MLATPSVMRLAPSIEHWRLQVFADLMPHQPAAVDFLASHPLAILADEMGLGKTVEAIRAADVLCLHTICVVAPKTMCRQWAREFARWQLIARPITVLESRRDIQDRYEGVYIISWSLLPAMARHLSRVAWHVIIADEAQYAKNAEAARTIALYGAHASSYGLVRSAHRVWLLSGGLTPNNPAELWPHLHALWPERINRAKYWQFVERYCVTRESDYGPKIIGAKNTEELLAILKDIRLARTARLLNLPPLHFGDIVIDPTQAAHNALRKAYGEHPAELETLSAILNACRTDYRAVDQLESLNVQQSALRHAIGRIKAPIIANIMAEELRIYDHKLILFGWHLDVLAYLQQALAEFGVVRVIGADSAADRERAKLDFQSEPSIRVFIGQIIAGGLGIDLTAGNQVVFAEMSWCPLDNLQAAKRPHRIGQIWPVYARSIALTGSIDEHLSTVLMRKMRMINAIQEEENRYATNPFGH